MGELLVIKFIDFFPLQNETTLRYMLETLDSIKVGYTSAITIVHLEIQNNYVGILVCKLKMV